MEKKKIDVKRFLSDVREAFPALSKYPDDVLIQRVQEHPEALEAKFPGLSQRIPTFEFSMSPDKPENILQKAVKAFTPQSSEEWADVPKIAAQGFGLDSPVTTNPLGGIVEAGSKMFGMNPDLGFEKGMGEAIRPQTEWGKTMDNTVTAAQLLIPGAIGLKRGGVNAVKGIVDIFKKPGRLKEEISDVVASSGPGIKEFVNRAHNVAVRYFGNKLKSIQGKMPRQAARYALEDTAMKMGGETIKGTPANQLMEFAKTFDDNKLMDAQELQALVSSASKRFRGNNAFKKYFVDDLLNAAEPHIPELKPLRQEYAEFGKIREAGRKITPKSVRRASGVGEKNITGREDIKIGPQELAGLAEAEQTMGGMKGAYLRSPDYVKRASDLGQQYRSAATRRNIALGGAGLMGGNLLANWIKNLLPPGVGSTIVNQTLKGGG